MKVLPWTPYSTALLTAHPAYAKILVERGADNSASSRDAHNLAAGPLDIRDVFENLGAKDQIERAIRKGERRGVSRDALNAWMMDSPGCQVQGRDASEALRKQDGIVSVAGSYVEGRFARANQAHQVPLPFGLARVRPE
jgi:hypothetical protein